MMMHWPFLCITSSRKTEGYRAAVYIITVEFFCVNLYMPVYILPVIIVSVCCMLTSLLVKLYVGPQ